MLVSSSADQHLDFQKFAGSRSVLRQKDFYRVFSAWADETIKRKADVATIAGDLFDNPDPGNASIYVAVSQILKLVEAGIEVLAVSGNHDTPKSSRAHIYSVLSELPIHCSYIEEEVVDIQGVRFVLVPWLYSPLEWKDISNGDVLVIHTACAEMDFGGGLSRSLEECDRLRWKYMALGDWHKHVEVAPGAHYPGALEHCTFGEESEETGCIFYDTNSHKVEFWGSPARGMITLNFDLTTKNITNKIVKELEKYSEYCVRLRMSGDPTLINIRELEWHPLLQKEFVDSGGASVGPQYAPSNLMDDWDKFCDEYKIDKPVRRYGRKFLQ
jgi:DNA repair exonuclease SbcCD nuclease subunit